LNPNAGDPENSTGASRILEQTHIQQEGQHLLTGQRAANFRLLADQ